jgi:hypothetical protein
MASFRAQVFGRRQRAACAAPRGWSQIGGSLGGPYYGPGSRSAGTLGG